MAVGELTLTVEPSGPREAFVSLRRVRAEEHANHLHRVITSLGLR